MNHLVPLRLCCDGHLGVDGTLDSWSQTGVRVISVKYFVVLGGKQEALSSETPKQFFISKPPHLM